MDKPRKLKVGVLISQAPMIYNLPRWTGVAYLLYLAWETWQSNGKTQSDIAAAASSSLFWRGFFSNVFNPKSILFFISVVPGFIQYDSGGSGLPPQKSIRRILSLALVLVAVWLAWSTRRT